MPALTRRDLLALLLAAPAAVRALGDEPARWISLFDGRSLEGWKSEGDGGAFKVAEGQIVVQGGPASLFYAGTGRREEFKNFEFAADVMMRPGAESAICFHTARQSSEPRAAGLEVLVASGSEGNGENVIRRKTGSLCGLREVYKQFVNDNEWLGIKILVLQKQVQIRVNDVLVVDYIEPDHPFSDCEKCNCLISHGSFALQTRGSRDATYFKNIRVHALPDSVVQSANEKPEVDDVYREIIRLGAENYPVVDYHVHLKGGLTIEQALENSRRVGIGYGVAINCGIGLPVHDDATVNEYLNSMKGKACFVGLQGEGREWSTIISAESIARFEYVFTDAMTFTDDSGKRMRIWIPEEIGVIGDKQAFMEMYVKRIEGVMREPIDIYANATYLPDQIAMEYDRLWTNERMQRVIEAAVNNRVAIEINNRRRIPSEAFIKAAKAAGAKFSFGTNNAEASLGRLEYPIQMVRACGIAWQDVFVPETDGKKPIQLRTRRAA